MNNTRILETYIRQDLKIKMVFIEGPRQVGKTTLARSFIKSPKQYFNREDLQDRSIIKKHEISPDLKLVVLDEIHKYARWRTLVKGLYDKNGDKLSVIVTGSARLNSLSPETIQHTAGGSGKERAEWFIRICMKLILSYCRTKNHYLPLNVKQAKVI